MVQIHYPDRIDIITGLQSASGGSWKGKANFSFVDGTNANQPGAEWQFKNSLQVLEADIVIDLLTDGRIGGIEFLFLL